MVWLLGYGVMLLVGVTNLVRGVRHVGGHRRFLARAVRVPGVVVDISWESVGSASGVAMGMPVFQYHTREGRPMRAVDPVGANPPRFRPGMQVAVLYDPAAPHQAQLEGSVGTGKVMNVVGIVLGAAATVAGTAGILTSLT